MKVKKVDYIESLNNISIPMVVGYVKTFGMLAPLVAFTVFVVQGAFPVFPYVILAAAGGLIFGFKLGFLLSWAGALIGACLAYALCRLVAGEWVRIKILSRWGYDVSDINREMAFWSIILARVIPVVPTPLINAAAAVGGVPFWNFFFSSAIGKIPSALLYTGLGICLFKANDIKIALLITAVVILLFVAGRLYMRDRLSLFS